MIFINYNENSMSSKKIKPTANYVHLFLEDLIPERKKLIAGNYTKWWFALREQREFFGVLPLPALVIIIINMQAGEKAIGFNRFFFWKKALSLYLVCDISHKKFNFDVLGNPQKRQRLSV